MVGSKRLDPDIYEQNQKFWDRAWNGVKTPYTQMPELPYLAAIPVTLQRWNATKILDLGCGSGWLSVYLAREGFDVTGIDIAQHAIELGRQWAEQEQLPIKFEAIDITKMPYSEGTFDGVVANSIFEHLTYDLAVTSLEQVRLALKPGGVFCGCFDKVGGGPGEYFELEDHTHVYTDKGRAGMLLRYFSDDELKQLFETWNLDSMETLESGSRLVWATKK